jgi:hypothetical protein
MLWAFHELRACELNKVRLLLPQLAYSVSTAKGLFAPHTRRSAEMA